MNLHRLLVAADTLQDYFVVVFFSPKNIAKTYLPSSIFLHLLQILLFNLSVSKLLMYCGDYTQHLTKAVPHHQHVLLLSRLATVDKT